MPCDKMDVLREIALVREFLHKLSKGVDPTCDLVLEEDTVLNNKAIKDKLKQADSLLNAYYALVEMDESAARTAQKRGKVRFMLPLNAVQEYSYSAEPITISSLVYSLNGKYKKEVMCNLRAITLTELLEKEGYLHSVETDSGQINRIPTDKGNSAGITCIEKSNSRGDKYYICLYDRNAQKLVLEYLVKQ